MILTIWAENWHTDYSCQKSVQNNFVFFYFSRCWVKNLKKNYATDKRTDKLSMQPGDALVLIFHFVLQFLFS